MLPMPGILERLSVVVLSNSPAITKLCPLSNSTSVCTLRVEVPGTVVPATVTGFVDRKSTRLNSSHRCISHARFCFIKPGQLTAHADRGSSRKANPVALLLADVGVFISYSRPHVSDDNPYSASQFRTLK